MTSDARYYVAKSEVDKWFEKFLEASKKLARAEKVVEAARNTDLASACSQLCEVMTLTRGCTCGDKELRAALAEYDKLAKGESETLLY